jgi:HD-like signal output (HDOD) protein
MFEKRIEQKLESIRNLITIPVVAQQVLAAVDDPTMNAATISALLEQDQSLVARILRVANSPFYGFARKISTVELAIVVLGTNAIKEIIYGLSVKKIFKKVQSLGFDIESFWTYSLFCGSAARVIARKLQYKLAGEAFVAGLMHDIGILVIVQHFSQDYIKIKKLMHERNLSLIEAEMAVLNTTHSEIGAWLVQKWNLPDKLIQSILNHHIHFTDFLKFDSENLVKESFDADSDDFEIIDQPLTAIVSIAEWFARKYKFYQWNTEKNQSTLYISNELFNDLDEEIMDTESSINLLQNEIYEEFVKASVFGEL